MSEFEGQLSDQTMTGSKGLEEGVSGDRVRLHLQRILASARFQNCPRIREFLAFIVAETLAGRGDRLKEHTIAQEVFHKDETFDPKINSVVRVEAGRLRSRLRGYYRNEGKGDAIHLEIPKGSYLPRFRQNDTAADQQSSRRRPEGAGIGAWFRERQLGARAVIVGFALVVLAAVAALTLPFGRVSFPEIGDEAATVVPLGTTSIAVLPLDTLSEPPGEGHFGEGLSDEISAGLTRFKGLSVVPKSAAQRLAEEESDPLQAGRDMGVDYLLEGSVRRDQDALRVTLQLVDLEKGLNIWANSYDMAASATETLDAQRQIAEQVVATIGDPNGVISRAAMQQVHHKDAESLSPADCVLRLYAYRSQGGPKAHRQVRHCLTRAVGQAPNHADAWAGLAWIHLDEHRYGFNEMPESKPALERTEEAAQKALALDPSNARAHLALAITHHYRRETGEFFAAAKQAKDLNPNDTDLLAELGTYLSFSGRWALGRRILKEAKALNPTHPAWYDFVAVLDLYRQGDYQEAVALARKLNAPDWYWTHVVRAMACGRIGDAEGVKGAKAKLMVLYPDFPGHAREEFRRLGVFSEDLIADFLVGLQRAGLNYSGHHP